MLVLLLAIICLSLSLRLFGPQKSHGAVILLETGPPPEFVHRLRSASQVDMIATTGLRFLQIHKQALIEVLRNNGHIRVLVAKPRSQFLRDVRDMESSPSRRRADLGSEVEMAYQTLQEMREETPRGQILMGRYGTHMRSSIILIDRRVAWINLVLPPKRAVETPGLYVQDDQDGRKYTALAVEHLARIWDVLPESDKVEVD
jgi:hypothetical protein